MPLTSLPNRCPHFVYAVPACIIAALLRFKAHTAATSGARAAAPTLRRHLHMAEQRRHKTFARECKGGSGATAKQRTRALRKKNAGHRARLLQEHNDDVWDHTINALSGVYTCCDCRS